MSGFKLLAIRPLKGCDSKFKKTLSAGTLYTFYNNFQFLDSNNIDAKQTGSQIATISKDEERTSGLFSASDNSSVTIDISAIVGSNGSGKSSLSELLYAAICCVSIQQGFLPNKASLTSEIKDAKASLTRLTKKTENKGLNNGKYKSTLAIDRYRKEIDDKEHHLNQTERFTSEVKMELYYSFEDKFYCVYIDKNTAIKSIRGNVSYIDLFHDPRDNISLNFFYTIALNYSSYGLNSSYIGDWVKLLFHKNDGYKTPLVINPMRTDGDYYINTETHLAQTRVLTNIVNDDIKIHQLLEGKAISEIVFELPDDRKENLVSKKQQKQSELFLKKIKLNPKELIIHLLEIILDISPKQISNLEYSKIKHIDLIEQYVIQKLFKIARTYEEYRKDHYKIFGSARSEERIINFKEYLKKLRKDKSHKTLKLRQILWLIRFNTLKGSDSIKWSNNQLKMPIEAFKSILKEIKGNIGVDIKELLPLSFYYPKIIVANESSYELLSSGEQQLINVLNTVYYHLSNIDSVFNSVNEERVEYKNVCILLDEIELYFHPNFQRRFIHELLLGIKELNLKGIRNINILFCTHSPFILSDIPSRNIMRLEKGQQLPKGNFPETFGANIHDLLANDFFLKDGFIGEFAKRSINKIIKILNQEIAENKKQAEKKAEKEQWDQEQIKRSIDLIGEPLIRNSLLDLYNQAYFNDNDQIDAEIDRLKKRKEQLKK